MLISGVEIFRYSLSFRDPVMLKGITLRHREGSLVRLTSERLEGWGEVSPLPAFSPESPTEAVNQLRPAASSLLGQEIPADGAAGGRFASRERSDLLPSVRFGLETALLNLSAASRGRALPQVLTDRPRETIHVSGLLPVSTEETLSEAVFMRDEGYRAVKLKVGRRAVSEDAEVVRKVRGILGGGVRLRLDANRAWSFGEAEEFAGRVSGVGVEYVEEPLAAPGRLPELARSWGLPVALDESLVGMEPEGLEGHPYARAVVLKPTLLGGISRSLRLMERARALGMTPVVSASYEGGVGTAALVALAATGDGPAGLDTYRSLAEDVLRRPLALPGPAVDVRETMEAARGVDVGRLEPVPLR